MIGIRIGVLACAVLLTSCKDTEQLEQKVAALEQEVGSLRKERGYAETKLEQVLRELERVERRLDELARVPPARPSTYPSRPTRRQPDPDKVYAIEVDPRDPVTGPSDALVTIVEGYEYACPFCERVRPTIEELVRRYGKDVRVVYKQLVVHPATATAPALAICAANQQRKFAAMDRLLWDAFKAREFDKRGCEDDPAGCPVIERLARQAGLDRRRLREDMREGCATWLRDSADAFRKLGTTATPTFFINGRHLSGAQPVERFAALVDEELEKARSRIAQGTPRATYYETAVVLQGQAELDP